MLTKEQWKRRKRRLWYIKLTVAVLLAILILLVLILGIRIFVDKVTDTHGIVTSLPDKTTVTQDLLTVNEYSRPGDKLETVSGIVIHFAGNPGASAEENRNYFESLRLKKTSKAGTHFIVGIDGSLVQCIPTEEVCNAVLGNKDTISILYCHETETGELTEEAYEALVKLTAYLCEEYDLGKEQIIRHYDLDGSECPGYFAVNQLEWEKFRAAVVDKISVQ